KEDILLLLDWFLNRFRKDLDKDVHGFSPDALDLLLNYSWPGNVRQMQSVLKQSLVQATGPVLLPDFLPPEIRRREASANVADSSSGKDSGLISLIRERISAGTHALHAEVLEAVERTLITEIL